MKNIKYFIGLFVIVMAIAACEKEDTNPVLSPTSGPELLIPTAGSQFIFTPDNAEENIDTFRWSTADFGVPTAITYTIEIDNVGDNFDTPTSLGKTTKTFFSDKNVNVNSKLIGHGLFANAANDIELRIAATVGDQTLYSNPATISVSPFQSPLPVLNVPGSYQGWDPASTETVIYSRSRDDINFDGFVWLESTDPIEYKFARGSWDNNWGDNGSNAGVLEYNSSNNIMAVGNGMHYFHVDLDNLTYSAELTSWGVLGDATANGWDSDADLTYSADTKVLSTTLDLTQGEIKFRANDDWALSIGQDPGAPAGILSIANGANIPVPSAGNYTINLYLSQESYSYELIPN